MPEIDWGHWLRAGDRLVASHMSAEPSALLASLAAHGDLPRPLHLLLGVPFTETAAALPPACEITTFGGMGSGAALAAKRSVAVSPLVYSRCEQVFDEGAWACDVALVSLARDARGRLFLGPSHGPVLAAARRARHVIAQVSACLPALPGAEWPADLPLAATLEVDDPACATPQAAPGPVEAAIGLQVAALVPDGACLQVGIGALPSALLQALGGHRHLGVHTGMLGDALHALVGAGVVDGSRKPVDAGVAVAGAVCGTPALFDAVRRDPGPIVLRRPRETHAAEAIARLDDLVCVNSAIEVDLLGNVNAEAVPGAQGRWRFVGGVGGLPDFVRGARAARRGRSVIALPARSPGGQARVVARLNGPCTLAACDADTVVTEQGVAHLRDAPLAARAQRMIAIAHEHDRDTLQAAARSLGLL